MDFSETLYIPAYDDTSNSSVYYNTGARVFGMPVSKELGNFLDDAYYQVRKQRLVDMYLAGNSSSSLDNIDYEDDEF